MKNLFKSLLKFIAIFSFVTVVFYIIVFSQIKWSFDYPNSLSYEYLVSDVAEYAVYIFCSILYAYLGLRFIKKVMEVKWRVYQQTLAGTAFFAIGWLNMQVGPAFYIGAICNATGDYLLNYVINAYGAENEITMEMKVMFYFMMLCIFSVTFALICYDAAEKYYIKKSKKEALESSAEKNRN